MKYIVSLLVLLIGFFFSYAQADLAFIADPLVPDPNNNVDCANCGLGGDDFGTGIKLGMGYGIAKEVKPDIDLIATIGYAYWRYQVQQNGTFFGNPYIQDAHLFNLAIGGRVHLLRGETSSLFTGMNVNVQYHDVRFRRRFGLSIEPTLGWCRSIGDNHEFFAQVGYDQHVSSYSQYYQRHPRKVSVAIGFNLKIGDGSDLQEE